MEKRNVVKVGRVPLRFRLFDLRRLYSANTSFSRWLYISLTTCFNFFLPRRRKNTRFRALKISRIDVNDAWHSVHMLRLFVMRFKSPRCDFFFFFLLPSYSFSVTVLASTSFHFVWEFKCDNSGHSRPWDFEPASKYRIPIDLFPFDLTALRSHRREGYHQKTPEIRFYIRDELNRSSSLHLIGECQRPMIIELDRDSRINRHLCTM